MSEHADYDTPAPPIEGAVAILGGTGALGFGVAVRLAAAGTPVVIGSRDAGRAVEAADDGNLLRELL